MQQSSTPLFTDAAQSASVGAAATEPLLIATSSNSDLPVIRVNGVEVTSTAIAQEMQYHPADSQREVVFLAAQALVLQELLKQRAAEINLEVQVQDAETYEEASTRCLLEQEISTPEIGDTELETFYNSNPRSFTTPPLVSARHILIAADPEDDLERSTQREIALNIIEQLQAGANFAAMAMTHSACPSKPSKALWGNCQKDRPSLSLSANCYAYRWAWLNSPSNRATATTLYWWSSVSKASWCLTTWSRSALLLS